MLRSIQLEGAVCPVEFDPAKDAANRDKHGLGLDAAARLEWNDGSETIDDRFDYGEIRYVRVADLDGRLHVCLFALRGGAGGDASSLCARPTRVR